MSDFKQARVPQTRRQSLNAAPKRVASHGRSQSSRTPAQQKEHEASYGRVYMQRQRDSEAAAKAALKQHIEERARPLLPNGPFGQFTPYQLLALEFADRMPEHVPAEKMATASPASLNSSCVQRFARLLTTPVGKAPFKSIADMRCASESAISDFVLLRHQLQSSPERRTQLEQMLSYAKETLRINSPYCAELKQVSRTATLLAHHKAVSLASKPRMGARPKAERAAGDGGLQCAQNYEGGMHTGEYINKHVSFDNRRFGVAATHTQQDVCEAMGLTTRNSPPLSAYRGHQQKRKRVHVAGRRTASMWMFQVDGVMNALHSMPRGHRVSVGDAAAECDSGVRALRSPTFPWCAPPMCIRRVVPTQHS